MIGGSVLNKSSKDAFKGSINADPPLLTLSRVVVVLFAEKRLNWEPQ